MLLALPRPPDPLGLCAGYLDLLEELRAAAASDDPERAEEALLAVYCALHGHAAPYTTAERARMDATGGYWCHAGGLTPVLKAAAWTRATTRSIDLGAGNGLQLLLLQALAPHARSVQVELSLAMIGWGRALQAWLGIPPDRVRWLQADVADVRPRGCDLVYLYRPVRPDGPAGSFYPRLAAELGALPGDVRILSVADCLGPLLPADFETVYADGQLSCFARSVQRSTPARPPVQR